MSDWRERYGPWALVTGASSGVGAVFARRLAVAGLDLVIVARRLGLLEELRLQLIRDYGMQVRCVRADLSQEGCARHLTGACKGMDVGMVINNGGSGVPGPFARCDVEREKGFIRLNCVSPMEITRHFLTGMLERGRGAVILVSSLLGFQGVPYMANYSATKGLFRRRGVLARRWQTGSHIKADAAGLIDGLIVSREHRTEFHAGR